MTITRQYDPQIGLVERIDPEDITTETRRFACRKCDGTGRYVRNVPPPDRYGQPRQFLAGPDGSTECHGCDGRGYHRHFTQLAREAALNARFAPRPEPA